MSLVRNRFIAAGFAALSLLACATTPNAAPQPSAPSATTAAATEPAATASTSTSGKLRWFGGPTVWIERGGLRILTDPMLSPRGPNAFVLPKHPSTGEAHAPVARYTDPPDVPLGALDAVIISHGHADHFDARAKELLPKDTLIIVPPSAEAGVRAAGFTNVRALDWGQETQLQNGQNGSSRLRITAVAAHHAHEPGLDGELGKGNGYVFTWDSGGSPSTPYVAYWTGDAVLSPEMEQIPARFGAVNLFLPDMGAVGVDGRLGRRSMDADEALRTADLVRARHIIPIHHTTFGHYREPVAALVQRAAATNASAPLHVLREGELTALEP